MTLVASPVGHEVLDSPSADPEVVRAALRDVGLLNALLGGRRASARGLDWLLRAPGLPGRMTLLDVGAGAGDLTQHLVIRARRRGLVLQAVALDRHPEATRLCGAAGLQAVLGDGGSLPLRDGSVDIVLASQLLHHLERASAIRLVQELDRVSRRGVIIADLFRSPIAMAGIWLVTRALRLHPATRRDGLTSVRRGYTPAELSALLADAGIRAGVQRSLGYRLIAVWRTSGAHC